MATPQAQALNPYATPKATVADEATNEVQPVKVFSVSGRIGRARYIAYGTALYLLVAAVGTGLGAIAGQWIMAIAGLAYLIVGFMLTIQRCHDFNASGWLSLVLLVPLVNLIFWIIPGSEGRNRWGAPTPPNGTLTRIVAWLLPAVFVLGIVAAVTLPAYQSYVKRAQQVEQQR
ncbi:MAG TPA: DUF805 domain-containing protein [Burkholderiales bacterium]|nr:DUF805 domain-containing protein [Burkholderiales bacterium]